MEVLFSLLIGYLIGTFSPSALISKLKKIDLRNSGTKNLGATNTTLTLGKRYGVIVMLIDITKAVVAVKLARALFPALTVAGLLSGSATVVGHIFPFYLKFKGGKGLAPFGGMVLAVDPMLFLILLVFCTAMMLIVNYGVAMPMSAAVLFPILHGIHTGSIVAFLIAVAVSILLAVKHYGNLCKAINGEDMKVRDFVKEHILQ